MKLQVDEMQLDKIAHGENYNLKKMLADIMPKNDEKRQLQIAIQRNAKWTKWQVVEMTSC
jgi:hypothetical protein